MIVLVGASGYFGQSFARAMTDRGMAFQALSRQMVNYYDVTLLTESLRRFDATFVINAAGFTGRPNVDACELDRRQCLLANAALPGIIQSACDAVGIPCGHLMSGCIFTGCRPDGGGFHEQDPPNFTFRHNNCSFYAGCKSLAEESLIGAECCYLWRVRLPFSHVDAPRNLLSKLLAYQRLVDARNSLSRLEECVDACLDCWIYRKPFGIYHLTNGGSITTREIAAKLIAKGLRHRPFDFFRSEAEFRAAGNRAPRSHCVLDNSKALQAGLRLTMVDVAIDEAIDSWRPNAATDGPVEPPSRLSQDTPVDRSRKRP